MYKLIPVCCCVHLVGFLETLWWKMFTICLKPIGLLPHYRESCRSTMSDCLGFVTINHHHITPAQQLFSSKCQHPVDELAFIISDSITYICLLNVLSVILCFSLNLKGYEKIFHHRWPFVKRRKFILKLSKFFFNLQCYFVNFRKEINLNYWELLCKDEKLNQFSNKQLLCNSWFKVK